jgi:hypothetical protein
MLSSQILPLLYLPCLDAEYILTCGQDMAQHMPQFLEGRSRSFHFEEL